MAAWATQSRNCGAQLAASCQVLQHRRPVERNTAVQAFVRQRKALQGLQTPRPAACALSAVTPAAACAATAQTTTLLDWLVQQHDAQPATLKVERQFISDAVGHCLIATEDIEPDEVTDACFCSAMAHMHV
jgi:hypothetical protein